MPNCSLVALTGCSLRGKNVVSCKFADSQSSLSQRPGSLVSLFLQAWEICPKCAATTVRFASGFVGLLTLLFLSSHFSVALVSYRQAGTLLIGPVADPEPLW